MLKWVIIGVVVLLVSWLAVKAYNLFQATDWKH